MHDTTQDPFHADFEAAVIKVYDEAGADEPNLAFRHGAYTDPLIQSAWWAWNASREALVVELPIGYDPERAKGDPDMLNVNDTIQECRHAIEAQGLKVAP